MRAPDKVVKLVDQGAGDHRGDVENGDVEQRKARTAGQPQAFGLLFDEDMVERAFLDDAGEQLAGELVVRVRLL